jgi:hypothetical protein
MIFPGDYGTGPAVVVLSTVEGFIEDWITAYDYRVASMEVNFSSPASYSLVVSEPGTYFLVAAAPTFASPGYGTVWPSMYHAQPVTLEVSGVMLTRVLTLECFL